MANVIMPTVIKVSVIIAIVIMANVLRQMKLSQLGFFFAQRDACSRDYGRLLISPLYPSVFVYLPFVCLHSLCLFTFSLFVYLPFVCLPSLCLFTFRLFVYLPFVCLPSLYLVVFPFVLRYCRLPIPVLPN